MAVSLTSNYSLTAAQLVPESLALLGVLADEEPLPQVEMDRALLHLNLMLKSWQQIGVMPHTLTSGTFALVQSDRDYVFGSGGTVTSIPFDLQQILITRSSSDLEMTEMSREDYMRLPNKTTEGYPTQWYYDRQRDSGTLYVWPAPDATGGTITWSGRRRLLDVDAQTDNMDLPQEWYDALLYGLAERLILPYGKAGSQEAKEVKEKAAAAFIIAQSFAVGEGMGSLSITPDY